LRTKCIFGQRILFQNCSILERVRVV